MRNLINLREFRKPEALIQRCNEIWEDQSIEEAATAATAAAAAAATARLHSPFRDARRSSSPFRGGGLPVTSLAATARRPLTHPEAVPANACVYTTPVLVPRPRSTRRAALTRKTVRPAAVPYTASAAGHNLICCPPHSEPASATAMSFLPAKNLIFLQDTKSNFKFLVDSGASLSILPHSSPAPPTRLHLEGANGKQIPT